MKGNGVFSIYQGQVIETSPVEGIRAWMTREDSYKRMRIGFHDLGGGSTSGKFSIETRVGIADWVRQTRISPTRKALECIEDVPGIHLPAPIDVAIQA